MKVERSILVDAKPERVWQSWVNEINAWWTKPYYMDAERVTGLRFEPRLGGLFIEEWGQDTGYMIGQIIEWLPPRRLAYTWSERSWSGITTLVRLEFLAEGNGTRLTLLHEGFGRLPDGADQRAGYERGQADLLGKLKAYIEKG